MKNYVDEKLCSECRGQCCRHRPGNLYPEDLGSEVTLEKLVEMLSSGFYCVDSYEQFEGDFLGDGYVLYYLRPHMLPSTFPEELGQVRIYDWMVEDCFRPRHDGWWGVCILLNPDGCSLGPDDRPRDCREMVPGWSNVCPTGEDVYMVRVPQYNELAGLAWEPYRALILEALNEVEEKELFLCNL